jgi:exoribonuclease-2
VAAQITQWATELGAGQCPEPVREQLYKILFKPDKNAPEYKAVVEAARATHTAPLELLQKSGAIASPYLFHWKRFLLENFPKGTGFPALAAAAIDESALPVSDAQAFSIDDSQTTEIDDALSVQGLGSGTITLGIHIAAPGWPSSPATRSTSWGAPACPRSTCRATKSPCCPMHWCRPTRCKPGATARRCRCT